MRRRSASARCRTPAQTRTRACAGRRACARAGPGSLRRASGTEKSPAWRAARQGSWPPTAATANGASYEPVYANNPEEKSRFTFLTKRLPRDNNFAHRSSSYSTRPSACGPRDEAGAESESASAATKSRPPQRDNERGWGPREHRKNEVMDMQRLGIYLVSLALTLGGYAARAAGDTKAADLLAQARAALGGESKLSKVQGLSASGTYQREMGDRQITGEITIDFQLPDKMVRTDSMNPMGDATIVVLQGVNGDQVLRHSRTIGGGPGMVVRMAPPAAGSDGEAQALRNQRADMARFALAFLLTSPSAMPVEFTYGGEAEAPDNDVAKADVVDAKGQGS